MAEALFVIGVADQGSRQPTETPHQQSSVPEEEWWNEDKEAEDRAFLAEVDKLVPRALEARDEDDDRSKNCRIHLPGDPSAKPWPDLRDLGTPIRDTPTDAECVEFSDVRPGMSELAIFNSSEFGDIRTVMEDGKPLFCAKDVATALGYSDSDQAVRSHCKAVKTCPVDFTGQVRHVAFIPESDVYRLVMRSKLPGAERFQDWVVEEVRHPQISESTHPSGPMASGDIGNFSAAAGLTEAGRF